MIRGRWFERVCLGLLLLALPLGAAESETMAKRTLRQIEERQRTLLEDAAKQGDKLEAESFRVQLQEVSHSYERFLAGNPNNAEAYAAYGYLLRKVDMRKQAAAMLLKANQLDSDMPLVKNQLGNLLAEDGRPMDALPYFMAAIKLMPKEPLYHYQVGTLLHEARDDFLKSGEWTRPALDQATHGAFKSAAELAPDRFEFGYRYAESFYDLAEPQWDEALKVWAELEEKACTPIERQTLRLHAANILLKQGHADRAKLLLDTVTEPELQNQKQKLIAPPAETQKK
ncbi:MAG: tetratricopeptide repeat protein [Undibacterium sp.]|nr:tetratricopeptide repeat protein [Opitutaceae bacterium]